MRRFGFMIGCLCAALSVRGDEAAIPTHRVVLCPITGEVNDGMTVVVKRALAEAKGAELLVLMVDTPGGMLDSAINITDLLRAAPCKTMAYVHGMGAISAGALITYSCDDIVMAGGTSIGASTPISLSGEMPAEVSEKTKSFLRSKYRSLGEAKGHDPYVGEAMVDPNVELHGFRDANGKYTIQRVRGDEHHDAAASAVEAPKDLVEQLQGVAEHLLDAPAPRPAGATVSDQQHPFAALPDGSELIDPAGELLTLTTAEAAHIGLTKATVGSLDEALALYELKDATRNTIVPTLAERLYAWLSSPVISGLLLMLGLAGVYLEIKTPGFGLPGVVGIVCLSLFFGAHLVLGLADWIDVLLVVIGIGLVLVEIFLLPGTTAAGAAGLICIVVGTYLALTRVPVPQYTFDYERLLGAGTTATVALFALIVFMAATWKLLPRTPLPRLMVQSATQPQAAGYTVQPASDAAEYLGAEGVAVTMLRPAGRARVAGKLLDVVTQGEFIAEGRPLLVMRVDGNRHVVRELGGESERG